MHVALNAASGSTFDGRLEVVDAAARLLGRDDDSGGGYNSLLTLNTVAGQTYLVQVMGFGTSTVSPRRRLWSPPRA